MEFNHVKIVQDGRRTEVSVDGVQMKGVRSVIYRNEGDEAPSVELLFYTDAVDIDINEEDQFLEERKFTL